MRDKDLETALMLATQPELIRLIESVEAGRADIVLVCQSVGFADERVLHDRVARYIRSCGAEPVLVPDGRSVRHPLPTA